MRVDLLLVEKGFASSRNRAQELIAGGRVFVVVRGQKRPVSKASLQIGPQDLLEVETDHEDLQFVSRGGNKMKGAIERTKLNVRGFRVLDVGISTGGFTDCLLQASAHSVIGIDVGHDQLAKKLKHDPRLKVIEGVNARDLSIVPLIELNNGEKFDLVVIDVSFISLTLVLPQAIQYLKETAFALALVKPQFEVGREGLGKNGIVKDPARYRDVEEKIRSACATCGLSVEDYFESSIEGSDGNREFFIFARPAQLQFSMHLGTSGFDGM
jgi:23S rRNA (cytidine1920-2'-O)/16S rRNA (cytidine1409-2'-O)-methyltransferase